MKHFHVQINARNGDDLDEAAIMKKVQSAGGSSYDSGNSKGVIVQ